MKKTKRFLAVLLCVCALLGIMAPAASASSGSSPADTTLSKVQISIDGPVIGEVPAETAKLDSASTAAGCYVKGVKWSGELNMWDKFQGGQTYTATITLGIKSGKNTAFSDEAFDAYVNGTLMEEVIWNSDKELVVVAEFEKTKAPTILNEVRLTITTPQAGKAPDKSPRVPKDAPYFVNKITWSGLSGGKFQAGKSHTADVTLHIHSDQNTWFSDKTLNVYVNDTLLDEVEWHSNNEIYFPVTFEGDAAAAETTAPTVLKEAKITLTAPETGKTPATTAKVPSGVSYKVKKVEWTGALSSGKFKENTTYTAKITLGIVSGANAAFSDESFDAYVNGTLMDEIKWNSATEIVVTTEFTKTPAKTSAKPSVINKIILTIDAPAAGKKPATTAKLSAASNGTVNSVVRDIKWSGELNSDGTFMSGVKYTVTFTMGIKSGANYVFSDKSIDATVNGKTSKDVLWYSDDHVEVTYTFAALSAGSAISKARITLEEPAVGKKPAQDAELPSTASTYVKSVRWEGALDSSGCFQAGTEYTAYVTLGLKDNGRKFSEKSFDAYVNGVLIDEVVRVSDKEIIVPVEFEKTPGTAPAKAPETTPAKSAFTDVAATAYYAQPVQWAVDKSITSGKTATTFAPGETCSQAQILTFLWRAAGSPEPAGTVEMEGFTGTEYYYKAAQWAAERGMVGGEFNPGAPCTRAMAVTYMWKQAGSPSAAPASFTDVPAGADYTGAVAWAVEKGVTSGKTTTTFAPSETCTRGQIVTFLYRAFAK